LTYNNLLPFTTYYWHVAAYSAIGLSEFCSTQMFTTGNISIIPAVPALWFPGNNAANQPLNATIRWNAAQYADHYHYQVARDSYFANVVQQNDNHLGTDVVLTPLEPNTRYYWRVRSGNPAGFSNFSNSRSFTTGTTTALEDDQLSLVNRLSQNQPNPFNPETVISFDLKDLSKPAKLTIYNPKGQVVKVLFEGTAKSHTNRITWDGKDTQGIAVASGIYYYILESSGYRESRKMLLMK
jgi:hypothetical protein